MGETDRFMYSWPEHQLEGSGQLHATAALCQRTEHPIPIG
jgi:hypothetical protein